MLFTWYNFYQDYWHREFDRLLGELHAMTDILDWEEALNKMQRYTGREWKGEMSIVTAQGAGKSTFFARSNITGGAPGAYNDAGFVHEGLHLLLREGWVNDPRIQKLMEGKPEGAPPYPRWAARYEQSVVAIFDILIRRLDRLGPVEKVVQGYFESLRLRSIGPVDLPLVQSHTEKTSEPFEDLMLRVITECETLTTGRSNEPPVENRKIASLRSQ